MIAFIGMFIVFAILIWKIRQLESLFYIEPIVPRVDVLKGRLTKSTDNSAGWDIYSEEHKFIPSQGSAIVKTGIVTEMSACYGLIRDRSGLAAKFRLSTRAGVIDADYRDEWCIIMENESEETYTIKPGDRIAQVLFIPSFLVEVVGSEVVVSTDKRTGGFGSTGTN